MLTRLIVLSALSVLSVANIAFAGEAAHVVFVAGQVQLGADAVTLNRVVQEGDELTTGSDGYVYLKTIDNGFLILRPNSKARIVSYKVDAVQPANTRIKLELDHGIARAISGEGAKHARENFRFNTPVAAIGVRGTDFTVYTDDATSRVAVLSGGVVVSGFSGACGPEGSGPCEGASSRELFARQAGQVLQISKGQATPQYLPSSTASPDNSAPPRSDEPSAKSSGGTGAGTAGAKDVNLDPQKNADIVSRANSNLPSVPSTPTSPVQPVTPMPPVTPVEMPPQIVWGRWQTVLDQAANIKYENMLNAGTHQLIASNAHFVLLRTRGTEWQMPNTGVINFGLRDSAAYITDESRSAITAANIENGHLQVDFAKATFRTGFDLVSNNERFNMQSRGAIAPDGRFAADTPILKPNNMDVSGVLSQENGGTAAYLFQGRIDDHRSAAGATYWTK
jgi:hypothetical protein